MDSGNPFYDKFLAAHCDNPRAFLSSPDGASLSYRDAVSQSLLLAGQLRNNGVSPGDRVAVQVNKSEQAVLLYLACMCAGAVYLPLNTAYTALEVSYFLQDAEPTLFISDPTLDVQTLASTVTGPSMARLDRNGNFEWPLTGEGSATKRPDPEPRTGEDLAAILYTSGTTGRSKGAMLSYDNLLSNADTLVSAWHFSESDTLLHTLPIFHTHGLFVAINVCLAAGAGIMLLPRFDAGAVLAAMPECTVMMGVPTFYTRLLGTNAFNTEVAREMRLFISGSAPLLVETHERFEARCGHRILERYGMTETNMLTSNPYSGDRRAGTVGFQLPGVEVRVVDPESGVAVPCGKTGSVEVKGANVFCGYWRMPEKTAEEFRDDGFFITGDLGFLDDSGYLTIVGRGKDLVISGGFNVYPKEVEDTINSVEGVSESAVIGVPHNDLGEAVVAVVVRQPDSDSQPDAIAATITSTLQSRLAGYKRPKQILFVAELPRNTMGKVQKNRLRESYADLFLQR